MQLIEFMSPSVASSPVIASMQTFYVKFIVGNISICFGCRNKYRKPAIPPDDICLQTEEWRQFTPVGSQVPQCCWSNTYYHLQANCVRSKWPMFNPQIQVIIERDVVAQLQDSHRQKIYKELGVLC